MKTNNEPELILKKYFGYKSFRYGQKEVIENILKGRDTLCIMPTSGGKSICYEVPCLIFPGITLCISPLISLMKDQVENLKEKGIKAAYVNSTLDSSEIYFTLKKAAEGYYKILYVSPERLLTPNFIEFSKKADISLIAIDEAHCVSCWGHDFRISYKDILNFRKSLNKNVPVAAFTATATKNVKKDIIKLLGLNDPFEMITTFDRPNIFFRTIHTNKKIDFILDYINKNIDKYGIIYCITRKDTEYVSKVLNEYGYLVKPYHAGMNEKVRSKVQDEFLLDKIHIIVATNAFGMGIDKPNVSYVIHYSMPKTIEAYYQEAGRCGRDGELSEAILLYNERDIKINEFMIENKDKLNELDNTNEDSNNDNNDNNDNNERYKISDRQKMILKKREYDSLKRMTMFAKSNTCLRHNLLSYFGEESNDKCNNCSKCYNKSKLCDVTIESQKILSTIKRTNEKETKDVIINILRGINKTTKKDMTKYIYDNSYDILSTYGILKIDEKILDSIITHLIENKYIEEEIYKKKLILKVTSLGKDVLNKKRNVLMRIDEDYNIIKKEKIKDKDIDETLYNLLKLTRKNISKKLRLPEFMIVEDKSLKEMAKRKPKNIKELSDIEGIGEYKTKKFGDIFLDVIYTYGKL